MTRAVAWLTAAALSCSSAGLGSRVDFQVSERPLALPSGVAGSCMPKAFMSYTDIRAMQWAIGASLEVEAAWPDRQDCGPSLLGNGSCPAVDASASAINPSAWTVTQMVNGAEANLRIQAVGAGDGGFTLAAGSASFTPSFVLRAATPSAIWFELARGPAYGDVEPGPVTEVVVPRGGDAAVAVTLRDAHGGHLCGPIPAVVTQTGAAFTIDRLLDADFVNEPYHLLAGDVAGEGSLEFTAGEVTATLRVVVGP
jgi:hypothetical protein